MPKRRVVGFYTKGRGKRRKVIPISQRIGRSGQARFKVKAPKPKVVFPRERPLKEVLFEKIQSGKIKAPFFDDDSFRGYLKKHGFTVDEAEKINLIVKSSAPPGIYASAGKENLTLSLEKAEQRGQIDEATILHEMGHIKRMNNYEVYSRWCDLQVKEKLEDIRKNWIQRLVIPNWGDLASWELTDPYFDAYDELLANTYSTYYTNELDREIARVKSEIDKEKTVLKERQEELRKLPTEISPATGEPYTLGSSRAKAIKKDIRTEKRAIKDYAEVQKLNESVKDFWKKELQS